MLLHFPNYPSSPPFIPSLSLSLSLFQSSSIFSEMSGSWADSVIESEPPVAVRSPARPTRPTYIPPHIRNQTTVTATPSRPPFRTRRPVEPNPLDSVTEKLADVDLSTGIDFDAYDDIPVEMSGVDAPPPMEGAFCDIDLGCSSLNGNVRRCGYVKPTPVQRYAMPVLMAGRDLMACAQTGSGKTAAFCFPIIARIVNGPGPRRPRRGGSRTACPSALILSPTRELSAQIHEEAKKFAFQTGVKAVVAYGGAPIHLQLRELERGVDILVATPGRLVDLIERARISLHLINFLALDEADRMLDMGFEPQIRKIVQQMDMPPPGIRQTMLFSATFPTEIQRMASDFLSNYIFLAVGKVGSSTGLIAQKVEFVNDFDKRSRLMNLLRTQKLNGSHGKKALTLIFVETKRGADSLEHWLSTNGFPATAIHGDKSQFEREYALRNFKMGATPIMVATDVAARGLDIPHVAHVINFDLPKAIDDYVHRIGRTGRAGKSGLATALFSEVNVPLAKALVDLMQEANQEVPSWLSQYAEESSYGVSSGRNHRFGGNRFGGRDFRKGAPPKKGGYYENPYDVNGGGDVGSSLPYTPPSYGCDYGHESIGGVDVGSSLPYTPPLYGCDYGQEPITATGWD